MRSLTLIGLRWFDRRAGNTYHTVTIIVDGETVHKSGITYGYGSQYEQTAIAWLAAKGLLPSEENVYPLSLYCRNRGIAFTSQTVDVARKRDL